MTKAHSERRAADEPHEEPSAEELLRPTKEQILAGARWARNSSGAAHIYTDNKDKPTVYYILSQSLVARNPGDRLGRIVAAYVYKLSTAPSASSWSSYSEYSYLAQNIRIVKRCYGQFGVFDCSCYDNRFSNCRHSVGVRILERSLHDVPVESLKVVGAAPKNFKSR